MPKLARLDDGWIEDGLAKIRSRFSNLVFFETEDLERYHQFLRYLDRDESFRQHLVFQYERWAGLTQYQTAEKAFTPLRAGGDNRFTVQTAQQLGADDALRDLAAALQHMARQFKRGPTLLIVKDMECVQEGNQDREPLLLAALRSWAQDPVIASSGSAVVCFASDVNALADQQTQNKAAIVTVDLGEDGERACMIQQIALQVDQVRQTLQNINRLVNLTAGLTLHQLGCLLLESYNRRGSIDAAEVARSKNDLIRREDVVEIIEPQQSFASIGGYAQLKDFIRRSVIAVLNDPQRSMRFGVPLPRGILLFGPPGTGKTLFSKALAYETRLPFINLKTENLFSKFLGESGRLFSKAIKIAEKNAPCIVFVDEIDRFGARTGNSPDGASEETRRVFNQILEWLGDPTRRSILIGTTNRPQDLDKAFTRPGRLDYKIPIFYPDAAARREILAIHLGLTGTLPRIPIKRGQEQTISNLLQWLAEQTENFSGAELEDLVNRIRRNAFNRGANHVEQADFIEAQRRYTINQAARAQEIQEHLGYMQEHTNDACFFAQNRTVHP